MTFFCFVKCFTSNNALNLFVFLSMRKGEDKYNQNDETCARVVPVSHSRGGHKQGQAVIIFVGDLPDKTSDTFEKFQRIFSLC